MIDYKKYENFLIFELPYIIQWTLVIMDWFFINKISIIITESAVMGDMYTEINN